MSLLRMLLFCIISFTACSVYAAKKSEKLMLSKGQEVKILHIGYQISMPCSIPVEGPDTNDGVKWFKDESPVDDTSSGSRFVIETDITESDEDPPVRAINSRLIIKEAKQEDIGYFDCRSVSTSNKCSFLVAKISYDVLPLSTEVDEGNTLFLSCHAYGDYNLKPTVNWFKESEPLEEAMANLNSSHRLQIFSNDEGLENAAFNISDTVQADRAHYTCLIEYDPELVYNTTTNVRIKDPLRALYPAVGIMAQALLLVITIYLCERNRTKDIEDDDDDDIATTAVQASS